MMLQLHPENFQVFWPTIRTGVLRASTLPEKYHTEYASNVLKNLLSGLYQTWLCFSWEEEEKQIHAVLITSVQESPLTEAKHLYVDSIFGHRPLTPELVKGIGDDLIEYAKSQGCICVRCLSNHPRIIELLPHAGFTEESTNYVREV